MGKVEKNWNENHATKVPKIPKTKRRKYGMKETKMGKNLKKKDSKNRFLSV